MAKEPKNHHYVPQGLLRQFCFEKNAVWYHYRQGKNSTPVRRNIGGIFSKDHYYSIDEDGQKSAKAETDFYQKVDNLLANIIKEAKEAFGRGQIPTFSGATLTSVKHLFSILAKRTPDFMKELEAKTLQNFENELRIFGPIFARDYYFQKSENEKKQLIHNARVRAQVQRSKHVLNALDGLKTTWAKPAVGKQFVIGSYPVMRLTDVPNARLGSEHVELWIPLGPRRMLGLVHPKKASARTVAVVPVPKVRELNEYMFKQSSEIASASEQLLASLMKQR